MDVIVTHNRDDEFAFAYFDDHKDKIVNKLGCKKNKYYARLDQSYLQHRLPNLGTVGVVLFQRSCKQIVVPELVVQVI